MTADIETLKDLRERVKSAKGPDKALDRAIMGTVGGWHRVEPRYSRLSRGGWIAPQDWRGTFSDGSPILDQMHGTEIHREVPAITGSVDAALALVRHILPEWNGVIKFGPDAAAASIGPPDDPFSAPAGLVIEIECGYTPAPALLAALLSALISEAEATADDTQRSES